VGWCGGKDEERRKQRMGIGRHGLFGKTEFKIIGNTVHSDKFMCSKTFGFTYEHYTTAMLGNQQR
jgi:hypothetical protein